MVSWLLSILLAVEGQLMYAWISHLLPDKMWRRELATAYKENRIVAAELVRSEDIEGKEYLKKLVYKYIVDGVPYECIILSDSFPAPRIRVLYEKEHPEISTPATDSQRWIKKYLPSWWMNIIVFTGCLLIAFLMTKKLWLW